MSAAGFMKRIFGLLLPPGNSVSDIVSDTRTTKHLVAKLLIDRIRRDGIYENIQDAEFKVYSQWGDDGIIQYLINNIDIPDASKRFVEFGVENYVEATTRFLLINNNWQGLVMDSSASNIDFIRKDSIYWKYGLTAVHTFVDAENIDRLLLDNGFSGEIGLLHIDIDGNDYWVWKGINAVNPVIVVVEYNSVFGDKRAVAVPYVHNFDRTSAHYSNLYWGASLKAMCILAEEKGYHFVGSGSNGTNAYFVRKDKVGMLKVLNPEQGYVQSRLRESRDINGNLTFVSGDDRRRLIQDLEVFDIEKACLVKLAQCF